MSNVFVLTDNKFIFNGFRKIMENKFCSISYFCSPSSASVFENEIKDKIIRPLKMKSEVGQLIQDYNLGFSCHSKQIFPAELVNSVRCINIHPGLNPFNRGWYPQVFSIINKHPAGATIHIMDEEIDHGPIISQRTIAILDEDTSGDVYLRILDLELELIAENMDAILDELYLTIQPAFEGNYNSKKDFNKLCELNLDEQITMGGAIDKLRALTHKPYLNAFFVGSDCKKTYINIELHKKKG